MPETSSMKGTSVYNENLCIKQFLSHKIGDFAMAFRVQKHLKYGPLLFESCIALSAR